MKEVELTYNEAYNQLLQIIELVEENKLDIDELSLKIKEASALLKLCKDKLFVANEEVRKILDEMK